MVEMINEELDRQYQEAINSCRYFHATDDHDCWIKETPRRKAAEARCQELEEEFKRRGLPVPNVP